MIFWTITSDGVCRVENKGGGRRCLTAYGPAFVLDTVDPHVYLSLSPQPDALVFRNFVFREHAEQTWKSQLALVARVQCLNTTALPMPQPKSLNRWKVTWQVPSQTREVRVGDVFPCKGGNKTRYWVVVALRDFTAVLLGFSSEGKLSSSTNYGLHVLESHSWSRNRIGHIDNLQDMHLEL